MVSLLVEKSILKHIFLVGYLVKDRLEQYVRGDFFITYNLTSQTAGSNQRLSYHRGLGQECLFLNRDGFSIVILLNVRLK